MKSTVLGGAAVMLLMFMTDAASARQFRVYTADYVPAIAIPDGLITGEPGDPAMGSLFVPDHGIISDVDVDFVIRHTQQGDLVVKVMAPNGVMVTLVDRPGSPPLAAGFTADNFGVIGNEFISDDEVPFRYDIPFVSAPGIDNVAGRWQPERPLSLLDGIDKFGEWKIIVTDFSYGQTGFIDRFSLHITNVPGPAGVAVLSLGLLGARRNRARARRR